MASRDAEEIRLHYCKKCGTSLEEHDDAWCEKTKYPALELAEYDYLFQWAKIYKIDLTEANEICADGGRHGAPEGDIMLDITHCIDQYMVYTKKKEVTLLEFVKEKLLNWGEEPEDIETAFKKLNNLEKQDD